jgi:hypothetical protein
VFGLGKEKKAVEAVQEGVRRGLTAWFMFSVDILSESERIEECHAFMANLKTIRPELSRERYVDAVDQSGREHMTMMMNKIRESGKYTEDEYKTVEGGMREFLKTVREY